MTNASWRHTEYWVQARFSVRVCGLAPAGLGAYLWPFLPELSPRTPASCNYGLLCRCTCPSMSTGFLQPGVSFSTSLPIPHPSKVDPSLLRPTLSLAHSSVTEIVMFPLAVYLSVFPTWELLENRHVFFIICTLVLLLMPGQDEWEVNEVLVWGAKLKGGGGEAKTLRNEKK